ncbi:hypothetical protein [Pedobacter miscanthi]|uniref:Uncharacterized protein n=1 Tax=Pedobacter miscanthi TaxID=2259170 RepID=A0A366LFM5_9SPHI|nr:hypothetical protein [Pedobacter miscanthi]RBQ12074.1 hypothetical protein DRW42_02105 [Pedobacter miscanthi]
MNTLKKISFGAFAFIFGLTLVLTQSAFKPVGILANLKRSPVTLNYQSSDFSQTEVEKESNWTTASNPETCDNTDQVPCTITIDNSYVSGGVLQNTAGLVAAHNSLTDTYYIDRSEDELMEKTNRAQ